MDNVIKRLISEELDKRETNKVDTQQEEEVGSETVETCEEKPQKRKKTEGRLTNLLNKIRRKADGPPTPVVKEKKIQVKWKRFCPINNKLKLVRFENGGGMRVITVPFDMNYTFEDLKIACLSLYFPLNVNKFMETSEECCLSIQAVGGAQLDDKLKLWSYVQEKGLVISKTTFVFTSQCFTNVDLSSPASFATVCSTCNCSSTVTPFGNCLYCEGGPDNSSCFDDILLPSTRPNSIHNIPAVAGVSQATPLFISASLESSTQSDLVLVTSSGSTIIQILILLVDHWDCRVNQILVLQMIIWQLVKLQHIGRPY